MQVGYRWVMSSTVIQVRDLPEEVVATLKARAELRGQSLAAYLRDLLTQEAAPGGTVAYTLTIPSTAAGTHAYYSGTQGDLQVEMGLYGAIIVLPSSVPANCNTGLATQNLAAQAKWRESASVIKYRVSARISAPGEKV